MPSDPITTPESKWLNAMPIHYPVWFLLFKEEASEFSILDSYHTYWELQ